MENLTKSDHGVQWILTSKISVVYSEAQRPMGSGRQREAQRIADEFDPDVFGVCTVTLPNESGMHHCIDGQTRIAGVRILWGDGQRVPCTVLNTKDPARAAEIFLKYNTGRTSPSAIENFHVAVTAKYEGECAVHQLVKKLGYSISIARTDGSISAVGTLMTIYKRHGIGVLQDTLEVIQMIWKLARESTESHIVRGMAQLLAANPDCDKKRLVRQIRDDPELDPNRVVAKAVLRKEALNISHRDAVAGVLGAAYNHGLPKHKHVNIHA